MRYRGAKAQAIHDALMRYIVAEGKIGLDAFNDALSLADDDALVELSCNGHSHLIDAMHIPFNRISDSARAADIAKELMTRLMRRCIASPKVTKVLLVGASNDGFTPLHTALKSGNQPSIELYLSEVMALYRSRGLSRDDLACLFTSKNRDGFTPLHQVACTGRIKAVGYYFNCMSEALREEELLRALSTSTNKGYLPSCPPTKAGAVDVNSLDLFGN